MDIRLPAVGGLGVLGHIRRQSATADIPVLLLSAKAESTDVAIGMRAGADDYITKPFELDDLVARTLRAVETPPGQRPHRAATASRPAAAGPRARVVAPTAQLDTVVLPPPAPAVTIARAGRRTGAVVWLVLTLAVIGGFGWLRLSGRTAPAWMLLVGELLAICVALLAAQSEPARKVTLER